MTSKYNVYARIRKKMDNDRDIYTDDAHFERKDGNILIYKKDLEIPVDNLFDTEGKNKTGDHIKSSIFDLTNSKPELCIFLGNSGSGKTKTFKEIVEFLIEKNVQ